MGFETYILGMRLDLVPISRDTVVAHLIAALGETRWLIVSPDVTRLCMQTRESGPSGLQPWSR